MNKFTRALFSILKFLLILAFCIAISFVIVWPLWKFATANAKLYTNIVLIAISALIVLMVAKKISAKTMRKIARKPISQKQKEMRNAN